jgi:predicted nuclease with TOPRIM domain
MTLLNMPYTEFVHLSNAQRDSLITSEIMKDCPSISTRIKTANNLHNERFAVASLQEKIRELEDDNKQLNETIEWMHQTIWDLIARNKALQRQLDIKDRDDPKKC